MVSKRKYDVYVAEEKQQNTCLNVNAERSIEYITNSRYKNNFKRTN